MTSGSRRDEWENLDKAGYLGFAEMIAPAFAQIADQRCLDARDMLAHQHLRAPGFSRNNRLEDAVMVVVTAADVVIFEHHDVAGRRDRNVMTDPDHFAEHAVVSG